MMKRLDSLENNETVHDTGKVMQVTMHLNINRNGNTNSHNAMRSKTFNGLQGNLIMN